LRYVLLQFAQRKSSLETKQSCELWVLFMVGPLPDDAGNNRHARDRQFDGSTSPCAQRQRGNGQNRSGWDCWIASQGQLWPGGSTIGGIRGILLAVGTR
jgi:hypothetical protein